MTLIFFSKKYFFFQTIKNSKLATIYWLDQIKFNFFIFNRKICLNNVSNMKLKNLQKKNTAIFLN